MFYGLLNYLANASTASDDRNGEDEMCADHLDPENEERKDFEAKLDGNPRQKLH